MNSPFPQNITDNTNASEGNLLPIKIKQKDLLDDSQSSNTEVCEDEIPSEIHSERPRLQLIELDDSQKHHHQIKLTNSPEILREAKGIFLKEKFESKILKKF